MTIAAVIVLFCPDEQRLDEVLAALHSQVEEVIVIDNTPGVDRPALGSLSDTKIVYHAMGTNAGIAEAQNQGIAMALLNGHDFILFLDQDSVPQENLVSTLMTSWDLLERQGEKVAAVGPGIRHGGDAREHKARIARGRYIGSSLVRVPQLISSGSLVRSDRWKVVGYYESRLFIDGVDFEWCWRARKKGLQCYRDNAVFLHHQFGMEVRRVLGVDTPIPSPQRCYYLYRNYLLLLRRNYVPLYWKVSYFFKFSLRVPYYSLFFKSGYAYFKNMIQGIRDGLKMHYGEPAK